MTIELSIFTNCIPSAPRIDVIRQTYNSFVETFGKIPTTIYIDPCQKREVYWLYRRNIEGHFDCKTAQVKSLSDGYIKSIKKSEADYLFQLEHDWTFQNIKHSLNEILEMMKAEGIYHFRFSKHPNKIVPELMKWQTKMIEKEYKGIKYVETDNLSNNPHIIDRKIYLTFLDRLQLRTGARGIEENLTKKGLIGCQYGGLDYPPTIKHLRGRKAL